MLNFEKAKVCVENCLEEIRYFLKLVFSDVTNSENRYTYEDFLHAMDHLRIAVLDIDTVMIYEDGRIRGVELNDPVPPKELGLYLINHEGTYIRANSFTTDQGDYFDPLFIIENQRKFRHIIVEKLCLMLVESDMDEGNELIPLHAKVIEIGIWRALENNDNLDQMSFLEEISRTRLSTDEIENDLWVELCPSEEIYRAERNLRLVEYHNIALAYINGEKSNSDELAKTAFAQAVARLMVPDADVPWKVLFREHLAFLGCAQKIGAPFIEIAELLADYRSPIFREISRAEANEYLISLIFIEKPEYQQVSVPSFCDANLN